MARFRTEGATPPIPNDAQIIAEVRRLQRANMRALCQALWPDLPWLPRVPGEDNARCTPFWWPIHPPLPDGRRAWHASPAEWLLSRCEELCARGRLAPAPQGEAPFVDGVATACFALPRP